MENNVRGSFATFWLGPKYVETRDTDGPSAGVIPPARDSIAALSVEQALSIGAVYRAVSIITSAASQMDLGVYRGGIEIDTPTIIKQPNVNETQRQFIKQTVWSLATYGNAYWRVYGDYPAIQNLEVLDPNAVTVVQDEKGRYRYWKGTEEIKNVKHLRLMTRPGEPLGIGPIQTGKHELAGALKVKRFAEQWFGSAGVPTGMLTTDQTLNAKDAKDFAEAFKKFIDEHGTVVLSQGMKYEYLNIKPADAQFLEIQQAQVVAIARLFGVPATLLASGNEGASNTYMNNQEMFMVFLQTTLTEYMNEIEDALSSLLPRGQVVNFKEDGLLRMNTVMETEVAVAQIGAGLITVDEWRTAHGLPLLPQSAVQEKPNTQDGSEQID